MHTQSVAAREKVFNIRFTEEEWQLVQHLAARRGLSAASLFRFLIKAEERTAYFESTNTKPPRMSPEEKTWFAGRDLEDAQMATDEAEAEFRGEPKRKPTDLLEDLRRELKARKPAIQAPATKAHRKGKR